MTVAGTSSEQDNQAGAESWTIWLKRHGFADLFGIKPGEPHPFNDLMWRPGEADQLASWTIYNEIRSRIITQNLKIKDGDEVVPVHLRALNATA